MLKGYKFRLYPTKEQETRLNQTLGCVRFVYNLALETKQMAYMGAKVNLTGRDIRKQLPELKEEFPWLKDVCSNALGDAVLGIDIAYKNFFRRLKESGGRRKSKDEDKLGYPKFKSKWKYQSFFARNPKLDGNRFIFTKFSEGIKIKLSQQPKGEIRPTSCRISRTPTGKYFVSLLYDTGISIPEKKPINPDTTVGIDLGLKHFIVTSNGEKIDNPRYLQKLEKKLTFVSSRASKFKGKRYKRKRAQIYEKIANQRLDFLHKVSTKIVMENHSIAVEKLNIRGMQKNRKLAKAISNVGWGMFVDMLKYKSEWYGRNFLQIGQFDPSTKTCSNCQAVNGELTLAARKWDCAECGEHHDRDHNAAKNIKAFALKKTVCGTHTENRG